MAEVVAILMIAACLCAGFGKRNAARTPVKEVHELKLANIKFRDIRQNCLESIVVRQAQLCRKVLLNAESVLKLQVVKPLISGEHQIECGGWTVHAAEKAAIFEC